MPVNEDGAEVGHIGERRTRTEQIADSIEKSRGIVVGEKRGGPNQEYALALAMHLAGAPGIAALAADTDGTDGGGGRADDPAGAFVDETTLARARAAGLDPAAFLADNNSTGFFNGIGDLFRPGPTFTNVTDFRAILVDSHANLTGF